MEPVCRKPVYRITVCRKTVCRIEFFNHQFKKKNSKTINVGMMQSIKEINNKEIDDAKNDAKYKKSVFPPIVQSVISASFL